MCHHLSLQRAILIDETKHIDTLSCQVTSAMRVPQFVFVVVYFVLHRKWYITMRSCQSQGICCAWSSCHTQHLFAMHGIYIERDLQDRYIACIDQDELDNFPALHFVLLPVQN